MAKQTIIDLDSGQEITIEKKSHSKKATGVTKEVIKKKKPVNLEYLNKFADFDTINYNMVDVLNINEKAVNYVLDLVDANFEEIIPFKQGLKPLFPYFKKSDFPDITEEQLIGVVLKLYELKRKKYEKPTTSDVDKIKSSASIALDSSAKSILVAALQRTPQYKVLRTQINLLKENLDVYKKIGDAEKYQATKAMIEDISEKMTKFAKFFKNGSTTQKKQDIEIFNEKIKDSEILKELKTERESLEKELKLITPASIYRKFKFYKSKFGNYSTVDDLIDDVDDETIVDLDMDDDDVMEVDNKVLETKADYIELCNHVADLIDSTPDFVMNMTPYQVKKAIEENVDPQKIEDLKTRLEVVKLKASQELKKIKGANDITDIMFEIFDFSMEEKAPKEILAAVNIPYVKSITYNICKKNNDLSNFDDAVADGLLGLTLAINKWYNVQKLTDSALSFEGYAYQYIRNAIIRGYYSRMGAGRVSGSTLATLEFNRKKDLDFFIKNNPEFADFPEDLIAELSGLNDNIIDGSVGRTIMASEYEGIVSDTGDDADIWANLTADKDNSPIDIKHEFENVIGSIKTLFSMFVTKEENGVKKTTTRKVFDYIDYLLFKMYMKIQLKPDGTAFNQTEMAEEIIKYKLSKGDRSTMTQSAVNTRLSVMFDKIHKIMQQDPEIKAGFEWFYYNRTEFHQALDKITYSGELVLDDNPFENQVTKQDVYNGNAVKNKTLNDIFSLDDDSPLDIQISKYIGI
jgi:hypothetical protein